MQTECVHCGQSIEFEPDDQNLESTCAACGNPVMLVPGLHQAKPPQPEPPKPLPQAPAFTIPTQQLLPGIKIPVLDWQANLGAFYVAIGALVGFFDGLLWIVGLASAQGCIIWLLIALGNILLGGVMYLGGEIRCARDHLADVLEHGRR